MQEETKHFGRWKEIEKESLLSSYLTEKKDKSMS